MHLLLVIRKLRGRNCQELNPQTWDGLYIVSAVVLWYYVIHDIWLIQFPMIPALLISQSRHHPENYDPYYDHAIISLMPLGEAKRVEYVAPNPRFPPHAMLVSWHDTGNVEVTKWFVIDLTILRPASLFPAHANRFTIGQICLDWFHW